MMYRNDCDGPGVKRKKEKKKKTKVKVKKSHLQSKTCTISSANSENQNSFGKFGSLSRTCTVVHCCERIRTTSAFEVRSPVWSWHFFVRNWRTSCAEENTEARLEGRWSCCLTPCRVGFMSTHPALFEVLSTHSSTTTVHVDAEETSYAQSTKFKFYEHPLGVMGGRCYFFCWAMRFLTSSADDVKNCIQQKKETFSELFRNRYESPRRRVSGNPRKCKQLVFSFSVFGILVKRLSWLLASSFLLRFC